jgi:hypothetical protein
MVNDMKNSSNVTRISEFNDEKEIENAWRNLRKIADRVTTLHSMMPKSLERTNKHLAQSVLELLDAIYSYDEMRKQ